MKNRWTKNISDPSTVNSVCHVLNSRALEITGIIGASSKEEKSDELSYIRFGHSLWSAINCQYKWLILAQNCNIFSVLIPAPADCLGCSILGMYLFGGKFCMWADRSRPCTCAEVVSRHPMCRCDRKHFNDIVWALVTVFQTKNTRRQTIFTQ
ncbi:hypothetical protein E2986_13575 [Frieseomelitta varia]|uniref:Uncharacterized protein n=1 Tax=Frieseomelitta varia TaxID=561572 RepID=A0A833RZ79_9HYME|nr:hypothetical protein E2986_13575 [Frieseomelitta varia]